VTPFIARAGAVSGVAKDGTAKDFFSSLFLMNFSTIVKETNRYARQCIARKPDPKWKDTSHEEMQAFFSLHVLFRYHNLPETSLYWEFSSPSLGVSEGRVTGGRWPVETSKGRCKRCLKCKQTKFCRMACTACAKRICLECFANHSEVDL